MIFVDTNYFLRYLIDDGSEQHSKVVDFFEKESKNKKSLATSVLVFFEIFWTITSFYKKTNLEAIEIMKRLLEMVFVRFEEKEILEKATARATKTAISLEDCFNLEWAKANRITKVASFDRKLLREWRKP